jgi:hypothetical protein
MSVADPEKPTAAVTFGMERRVPWLKRHVNPERLCNVTSTKGPYSDAISCEVGFIYLIPLSFSKLCDWGYRRASVVSASHLQCGTYIHTYTRKRLQR